MGYYPGDMMDEYLTEYSFYYDCTDKTWSWQEEDQDDFDYLVENNELYYDPSVKAAQIDAAKLDEKYIIVLHTGEFFESTEEAYLYVHEKELYTKILKRAFTAGQDMKVYGNFQGSFDAFMAEYTHA